MIASGRSLVALGAALLLGAAATVGGFRTARIGLVVGVCVLAVVAATASKSLGSVGELLHHSWVAPIAVALSIGLFVVQVKRYFPNNTDFEASVLWIGVATLSTLAILFALGRGGKAVFTAIIAVFGLMMVAVILFTTNDLPLIDVMVFQQDGAAALFRLDNPFALTFPDIYPAASSARFYADGLSVDGVLHFGYPYFPLGLLAVAPFELLADFRFAHLAAILSSAVMISRMSSAPIARIAAVVLVLASPSVIMVRLGFMDPLVLLTIVFVVLLAIRGSRSVSAMSGLIFATKQYTIFLVVPSLLLLERPWKLRAVVRHFASAAAVFLLVTLPFALWDFGAFWWSTIELQIIQPYRSDSVAIPALFPDAWEGLSPLVTVGGPVLAVLAISIWIALKAPTGGQGFALGVAAVMVIGFVTSKQAFANYYFVVIGALCAGAAALPAASDDLEPDGASVQRASAV